MLIAKLYWKLFTALMLYWFVVGYKNIVADAILLLAVRELSSLQLSPLS